MSVGEKVSIAAEVDSELFDVYNAKDFPKDFYGMRASTALTKRLKRQGCPMFIKKGNMRNNNERDEDNDEDIDDSGDENDMTKLPVATRIQIHKAENHSSVFELTEPDAFPQQYTLPKESMSLNLPKLKGTISSAQHHSRDYELYTSFDSSSDASESIVDSDEEIHSSTKKPMEQCVENQFGSRTENTKDLWPLLSKSKQQLVDQIMAKFWVIFNSEWAAKPRMVNGGSKEPTEPPSGETCSPEQSKISTKGQKRCLEQGSKKRSSDNGDNGDDDDGFQGSKRPRMSRSEHQDYHLVLKLACPYRKHNPQKYCISRWRSCALTPFDSVARVKGYLYRYHRIFPCPRCKENFNEQDKLNDHLMSLTACQVSANNLSYLEEGVTPMIETRLRSRKKAHPDQTSEERWKEMYCILFPDKEAPSPYFEPIQDCQENKPALSPNSLELADLEQYLRREVPRLFRASLETTVIQETVILEEKIAVDKPFDCPEEQTIQISNLPETYSQPAQTQASSSTRSSSFLEISRQSPPAQIPPLIQSSSEHPKSIHLPLPAHVPPLVQTSMELLVDPTNVVQNLRSDSQCFTAYPETASRYTRVEDHLYMDSPYADIGNFSWDTWNFGNSPFATDMQRTQN